MIQSTQNNLHSSGLNLTWPFLSFFSWTSFLEITHLLQYEIANISFERDRDLIVKKHFDVFNIFARKDVVIMK